MDCVRQTPGLFSSVTDDGVGGGAEIARKGFPDVLPGFVVVR